jgi:hypothetical protein
MSIRSDLIGSLTRRAFWWLLAASGSTFCIGSMPADALVAPPHIVLLPAIGTTYYVAPNGSNNNTGKSPRSPWKNLSKVNTSVFMAGDRCLFQGGQSFSGSLTLGPANWSAVKPPNPNAPVTFGSYGSGQAAISSSSSSGFRARNIGSLTLRDLIFTGSGGHGVPGVFIGNALQGDIKLPGVTVTNITVSGYSGHGIVIGGDHERSGYSGALISNCVVHDCTKSGINSYGSVDYAHTNITVTACVAYNIQGDASGEPTGSPIFLGSVNVGLIQFCHGYNSGGKNIGSNGPVGIWAYQSNAVTIQFCEADHIATGTTHDGGGFDLDGGCTNCTIQYCYSHDNYGHGFMGYAYKGVQAWSGNSYRFNISQGDGTHKGSVRAAFAFSNDGSAMSGIAVYCNTVFSNIKGSCAFGVFGSNVTGAIANNILFAAEGSMLIDTNDVTPSSSLIFRGNDYWSTGNFSVRWAGVTYDSLVGWQAASGQEMIEGINVGHNADPLLTNPGGAGTTNGYAPTRLSAYRLKHGSSMVGAGLNLQNLLSINPGARDFFNNTIPHKIGTGFNVGADSGTT